MAYQSKPTVNGTYLIKVLSEDLFIEGMLGDSPKLWLAPSSSSDNQKWNLTQLPHKSGVWKMTGAGGHVGVTCTVNEKLYWGHGHPHPHVGDSQEWKFIEHDRTFSKIKLNHGTEIDCFDACEYESNSIHFYTDQTHPSSCPHQCYVFQLLPPVAKPKKALDVIFLQDSTGSQASYINAARGQINEICRNLLTLSTGELAIENLRFGLIAFRDYPLGDNIFITKRFDFTTNPDTMALNLGTLVATGGGDGPEAQCDALVEALNSPWNKTATKVAVLITDSPPHGLGENSDSFASGCPCGRDPLQAAEDMLNSGITLYVVACEPSLSCYKHARHFYEGLTRKTHGQLYNLGDPKGLTDVIVGCLMQEADSDELVRRYKSAIRRDAETGGLSPEEISRRLYKDLSNANTSHYALSVDNMVETNKQGEQNIKEWLGAANLAAAKGNIKEAAPNRIKPEYLAGSSPAASMGRNPITLTQVEGIVQKSLARRH
ncbi:unnamed protein product [Rhizoctonia solani]|uniref:VWFA domain-containing protein n=1 Tax=Rhizoctonia solani TaxID=456999 RepID=A0A8H3GZS6_9AGAM|nr:unnamed protein product [Rhizoctonia solani]